MSGSIVLRQPTARLVDVGLAMEVELPVGSHRAGVVAVLVEMLSWKALVVSKLANKKQIPNAIDKINNARDLLDKIINFSAIGAASPYPATGPIATLVITPSPGKGVQHTVQVLKMPVETTSSSAALAGGGRDREDTEDAFDDDEAGPLTLNAFDLIILSQGLNLAALFDRRQDYDKLRNRFLSLKPAKVILSSMEVVAQSMGFKTHIRNYKVRFMRVEGLNANKTSHLSVMIEVFEVAPSVFMVDLQRAAGDTSEYNTFVNNYCSKLDDIIWKFPTEKGKSRTSRLSKC
nr:unnamed protein product [Digitaria exilis]